MKTIFISTAKARTAPATKRTAAPRSKAQPTAQPTAGRTAKQRSK